MEGSTAIKIQLVWIDCIPLLICFGMKKCSYVLTLFVNVVLTIRLFGYIQQVGTSAFSSSFISGRSFDQMVLFPQWKHLDFP